MSATDGGDPVAADEGAAAITIIDLDASAVAAAPFLGHRIGEFAAVPGQPPQRVPVKREWIPPAALGEVFIDVDEFAERAPFDEILGDGATTSTPVASVAELLGRSGEGPSTRGIEVQGPGLAVVVWAQGMRIIAVDPVGAALKLLVNNFSEQARQGAGANPDALQAALDVLPAAVKGEYVPDADSYLYQARTERAQRLHAQTFERQQRINRRSVTIRRRPMGGGAAPSN